MIDKTTIEEAVANMADQTDREFEEKAPRVFINEKEYVEGWYARELFLRLKMILFSLSNFGPGKGPKGVMSYRKGLANIAKHGVPEPEKLFTSDCHE
ncbi:hypothetical protein [Akkermansia massiliensis]